VGYYEARAEAAGEYASECAHEMIRDGDFNDIIEEMISEGIFDEAVLQRAFEILTEELKK